MRNRKIISVILLAALVLLAGIAWGIAKTPVTDPADETVTPPAEITIERILAANHPSTILRSGSNFLLKVDGEEKYQCFVDDGIVLKEDAASDKSSLVVDREYVVNRLGEDYDTVAVSESDLHDSWYADLVLNTSLMLKESIVSTVEEDGNIIVTTSLSGEDYDDHYNRAVRNTASCSTVYTLDSATCRVKSVTQTATQEDGTNLVNTLTLTENVETPATVSTMSARSTYTAAAATDDFELDKNGDGEINLLFIGNSYSYYWTDELWTLLNAAGYGSTTLNVCNLYRSGADFIHHWQEYERGVSDFELYTVYNKADGTDPHDPGKRFSDKNSSLIKALNHKQWDVISFQQGNDHAGNAESHRNSIAKHFPLLYDLVTSYHPNARFYWQQDWAHEYKSNSSTVNATRVFREVGLEFCREYGLINSPLGDAWEIVRHDSTFFELQEGTTDNSSFAYSLHSRVAHNANYDSYGFIRQDDNSHDGDAGGGQYLNACVWFEMLTKKRVEDTAAKDYMPVYSHGTAAQKEEGSFYIGLKSETRLSSLSTANKTIVNNALAKLRHAAHTAVVASYGEDHFID